MGTSDPAGFDLVGRLVGKSVSEIAFRVPYGITVTLGELLVGSEEVSERRFLLRITDILHATDSGTEDWPARMAGNMIRVDGEGRPFPFHDRETRLYSVAIAKPLGFLDTTPKGIVLRKPKTLPAHFSRVRRLHSDDLAFLAEFEHDLPVGSLRSGSDVLAHAVGLHGKWLPYHVGVFATTGMGKSNLMKRFLGSLLESKRYGVLVFDPHGEYYDGGADVLADGRRLQGLSHHPLAPERLSVYSCRPLAGAHNTLKISAYEITVADARNVFHFSPAQEEALWAVRELYGDGWLVELADKPLEEVQLDFPKKFFEGTLAVLKRRAEQILRFDCVHRDGAVTVSTEILRNLDEAKVVLVDTSGLYETEELLVSAVLARTLFQRNKNTYKQREKFDAMPPTLICLEEAQRVLGHRDGEPPVFAQIAREGRKFKTGLCAITQQPKLIPEMVLSQFNTYFILGLSDAHDRQIVAASAKQDLTGLEREIQTLERGEAIVASPHVPFAVPTKVELYEDYLARLPRVVQTTPRPVTTPKGFY